MSIHVLVSLDVFCDLCGRSFGSYNDEPATNPGSWKTTSREARNDMKKYGWVARRKHGALIDLCGDCVKSEKVLGGEE